VTANATSTVAIWPGTVASTWGYRRELREAEPRFRWLIVPSLVGGLAGALLLRWTPPALFDRMVPFLILLPPALHGPGTHTADLEDGWAPRASVCPLVCRGDVVFS